MSTNSAGVAPISPTSPLSIEDRVAIEQMRMLCEQKQVVFALAITVVCMTIYMWKNAPTVSLFFLGALTASVILDRIRSMSAFLKLPLEEIDIRAWQRRFVKMSLSGASLFVAMELIGYLTMPNDRWGLFDIAVVSACGAALGTMTLVPGLYCVFALPLLFVMTVFHAAAGGSYNLFVALGAVVVGLAYLITSRHVSKAIGQSLRLRMQNEILTEAAEQQQQHLAAILNNLPDATFVIDCNGVVTAWNRAAEMATGVSATDVIGKGNYEYAQVFYGERRPVLVDLLFERDLESQWERYSLVKREGDTLSGEGYLASRGIWFDASASPLRDAQGAIIGGIETVRNITAHKQLEEELQASERRLYQIIDLLPEATFVIDRNGIVTAWNRAAEQLCCVPAADIIGKGNYEHGVAFHGERRPILIDLVLLPEHELLQERYSHIRKQGDILCAETYVSLRNGRSAWIQGSAAKLRDGDGNLTGAIEMVIDLTERKQVEDDLATAREAAERASRAKADFLANMSHEIRTPMNAIIGMSHLALQTELSPKQRNYIEKIHRAADNLLGIINEILDFSKIEAGKLTLETIDFNLDDVLDNLANLLGIRAEDKGLELLFDIAPDIPVALSGDPLRLGQVLVNLGSNAVKFTERGDIIIGIETVSQTPQDVVLHFWVRDSGIGMTPEQQQNLFQSFNQADTSTTRKYGGTGLGLVISKNIVESMDGAIWVESEYGTGSTFHFHARFGLQAEPMPRRMFSADELAGRRVLVADDSANAREIFAAMSRAYGMEVELAVDGPQALEMIAAADRQASPYDLVLMDWKMPGIDGVECLRRIRMDGLENQPKVIMVTGYGRDDVLISAELRGVSVPAVLTKPVTASTLLETIGDTLGTTCIPGSIVRERSVQQSEAMLKLQGARLLLVEDNEMNQELALELLGNAGIDVVLATNGREALDVLTCDNRFDGVLMDCQMPVMDGYTATAEIRRNRDWAALPIIAMTANLVAAERERVLAAGMCDLIGKPVNISAMFETLARWIVPANPETASVPDQKTSADSRHDLPDSLPGIELKAGLALTMNNPALYRRMLIRFREAYGNFAEQFQEALHYLDNAAAVRAAHTLKGTAGTIGAKGVQHAAERLEQACRDKAAPGEVERLLNVTLVSLRSVIEGLSTLLDQPEISASDRIDGVKLRHLVDRLTVLLDNDDLEAGEVAEELVAATRGTHLAERVQKVALAVEGFDVDTAMEALRGVSVSLEGV